MYSDMYYHLLTAHNADKIHLGQNRSAHLPYFHLVGLKTKQQKEGNCSLDLLQVLTDLP